jgi:hypothetical protein
MQSTLAVAPDNRGDENALGALKGSNHYRFCDGKCQAERPQEGGVQMSPGKWRCVACWIELSRRRT